ncbi:uncharacterized protein LOC124688862 [Lolium rigidum]|uniref:uncharacterized protein LOC124688862 n=2 Tax=Lolium TaxID=4520 RepID=UPI001F5DA788|nr:uncharacterized protein LOC124688862 [Lolium rigidum]
MEKHNSRQVLLEPWQINAGAMGKKSNRDDRLSALPDDILVNILDRLNVPEAARTSILSKRWIRLSSELSHLIINAKDFVPQGLSNANVSLDDLVQMNDAAADVTKSMLTRRVPGEHTISLLSTTFYLRDAVPISIGHAVGNAMATHKIEKAEFTVLTEKGRRQVTVDDIMNYGAQFLSFFNECQVAFSGLTRLYLENLKFAESGMPSNILVTCKQLTYLGFLNCKTESLMTIKVEHAQLAELSFENCRFGKVELKWLPRLTRTKFAFWMTYKNLPLSFGHVPLLEVVTLATIALSWHEMVELSTLLFGTSVRELHLGFRYEKIWLQPECLTRRVAYAFHRLRIVNLDTIPEGYDLTWTMFILEAAALLEEFCMTVMDHPCEMKMDKEERSQGLYSEKKGVEWESPTSNFKHYHLTKLIIFCFESFMISHVRRVMKAAVNLKDVYLYGRLKCRLCRHLKPLKPTTFPPSKKHRCSMRNLLTQGIQSRARIRFLSSDEIRADHAAMILN